MDRVAGSTAWRQYLERSQRQRSADQAFLRAELVVHGSAVSALTATRNSPLSALLARDATWFASAEARFMAHNVVSFQTPAGGWSKNTDFSSRPRSAGQPFGAENGSRFAMAGDFDAGTDPAWSYVGTIDNDATTTELRFLAKVIHAAARDAALLQAFERGLNYLFDAQYPNGGWPQVWPLQGGYHDAVTYNDQALLNVVTLLRAVATANQDFQFVAASLRSRADAAWRRGLACILATQIAANGRKTVWAQQYDALTLQPSAARNYEMAAASSSESAALTLFLMELPDPDNATEAAVHAAAAWFEKVKVLDRVFEARGDQGRRLYDAPGAGALWARFYDIASDRPLFGDRDQSIHDDVNEISKERRDGYAWFNSTPLRVLARYRQWALAHSEHQARLE
jgi:PelA/Pel-15E family pectate lyase